MKAPEQLKAWRKRLGISQERAAEQLGVAHRTYTRWERGENTPDLRTAVVIAEAGGPKAAAWVE